MDNHLKFRTQLKIRKIKKWNLGSGTKKKSKCFELNWIVAKTEDNSGGIINKYK